MTLCPITHIPMNEPYAALDLHTYEKTAIETWLRDNTSSPMNRMDIYREDMREDVTMRKLIEALKTLNVDGEMLKNIAATKDPRIDHNVLSQIQDQGTEGGTEDDAADYEDVHNANQEVNQDANHDLNEGGNQDTTENVNEEENVDGNREILSSRLRKRRRLM